MSALYDRIREVVRAIPPGRVATYGQIARLAGIGGHARQVGYALHSLPEGSDVPWHRVINARGEISLKGEPPWEHHQQHLLEEEGVRFDVRRRVSLRRFGWRPEARAPHESR
ncbi:MGMT family protein [Candidatus Fermentibacteria bacterium]|nr:MGMT family protein [Candidatus Fermentibacteria bacterium]